MMKGRNSTDSVANTPILTVQSISKRYGKQLALDGVSLQATAGESLALWGANGAGKSTLIKAILGLVGYTGKIRVAGWDALRQGKSARRSIGYVPQEAIYYDISVRATLIFYARLKKADLGRIPPLLERMGLSEHLDKPVPALSGGLKQRLALAIALIADPPLLLLDEPTANLDTQGRSDYLALLAGLRREQHTILFASHRIEEVEILADRVLLMESGKLSDAIAPQELRRRLSPVVELTLWIGDRQRTHALEILLRQGLNAHMNGRGTLVVRVEAAQKLETIHLLSAQGIDICDFEIEKVQSWS
jgi:ABC-type multidrug transport system ATPase subunit